MRLYCGLASAGRQLTVAVVDDTGRILATQDTPDDVQGYAAFTELVAGRAGADCGGAAPVATDSDTHLVPLLLAAAGARLVAADPTVVSRFGHDGTVGGGESTRRAVALARALQAGALTAVTQPAPRDLAGLTPLLTAHAAVAANRVAAAAALREVLRALYPAALRAFADPAAPTALAVLDALPDPVQAVRSKDSAVVARLNTAGQAEAATAVAALRTAVVETPPGAPVAEVVAVVVQQAVAAVKACDIAAVAVLREVSARVGARSGRPNRPVSSGNASGGRPNAVPPGAAAPVSGVPISGAPISGAPISGAPISGAPISGAPISGAPISGAPISGVPVSGTPISGAPISGVPSSSPPVSGAPYPDAPAASATVLPYQQRTQRPGAPPTLPRRESTTRSQTGPTMPPGVTGRQGRKPAGSGPAVPGGSAPAAGPPPAGFNPGSVPPGFSGPPLSVPPARGDQPGTGWSTVGPGEPGRPDRPAHAAGPGGNDARTGPAANGVPPGGQTPAAPVSPAGPAPPDGPAQPAARAGRSATGNRSGAPAGRQGAGPARKPADGRSAPTTPRNGTTGTRAGSGIRGGSGGRTNLGRPPAGHDQELPTAPLRFPHDRRVTESDADPTTIYAGADQPTEANIRRPGDRGPGGRLDQPGQPRQQDGPGGAGPEDAPGRPAEPRLRPVPPPDASNDPGVQLMPGPEPRMAPELDTGPPPGADPQQPAAPMEPPAPLQRPVTSRSAGRTAGEPRLTVVPKLVQEPPGNRQRPPVPPAAPPQNAPLMPPAAPPPQPPLADQAPLAQPGPLERQALAEQPDQPGRTRRSRAARAERLDVRPPAGEAPTEPAPAGSSGAVDPKGPGSPNPAASADPISAGPSADGELPIFSAAQSAWFSGYNPDVPREDWNTPADEGWKAAEAAARPQVGGTTTKGLPRRVPKANLVPGSATPPGRRAKIGRDPNRLAKYTASYFKGWQRARHDDTGVTTSGPVSRP